MILLPQCHKGNVNLAENNSVLPIDSSLTNNTGALTIYTNTFTVPVCISCRLVPHLVHKHQSAH